MKSNQQPLVRLLCWVIPATLALNKLDIGKPAFSNITQLNQQNELVDLGDKELLSHVGVC